MITTFPANEIDQHIPDELYNIVIDGLLATLYTGSDTVQLAERPIIEVTAAQAEIMLRRSGYLETINSVLAALGPDYQTMFQKSPYVHSDNPIVYQVLSSPPFNKTVEEIYSLFVEAKLL